MTTERLFTLSRWAAVLILCCIALVGATGQTLVSILLEPLKADLDLSDTTIGVVTGFAIAVVGSFAAFPIGWAADRYGRRRVLALSILAWSAATILLGLAQTKYDFAVAVVGFNLGDAALLPLLYAMIPTVFADGRKHKANAILVTTLILSTYGSYAIGGALLNVVGDGNFMGFAGWRLVCLVVALAGLVLILALPMVPRGSAPSHDMPPSAVGDAPKFGLFLKKFGVTIVLTLFAVSIFYSSYLTLSFWAPAMLQRSFGLTTAQASTALGWPLVCASVIGVVVSNLLLSRCQKVWGELVGFRMIMMGCAAGVLPAVALPFAPNASVFLALLVAFVLCMTFSFAMVPLILQQCAPDHFRSRTIAFFPLTGLVARAIMPVIVARYSDASGNDPSALVFINSMLLVISLPLTILMLRIVESRYIVLVQYVRGEVEPKDRELLKSDQIGI